MNHRMCALAAFLALPLSPASAFADPGPYSQAATLHALAVSVNISNRVITRRQRLLENGLNTIGQILETIVDCGQTKRILLAGGQENDPIARGIGAVVVVGQLQRANPTRCKEAGIGAALLGLGVDHYWSPIPSTAVTFGEAINILSNAGQR